MRHWPSLALRVLWCGFLRANRVELANGRIGDEETGRAGRRSARRHDGDAPARSSGNGGPNFRWRVEREARRDCSKAHCCGSVQIQPTDRDLAARCAKARREACHGGARQSAKAHRSRRRASAGHLHQIQLITHAAEPPPARASTCVVRPLYPTPLASAPAC